MGTEQGPRGVPRGAPGVLRAGSVRGDEAGERNWADEAARAREPV